MATAVKEMTVDDLREMIEQTVRQTLEDYFEQQVAAGRLQLPSPKAAAAQFYMSLFGDQVVRLAAGSTHMPDVDTLEAQALAAVDLFLRGALPR